MRHINLCSLLDQADASLARRDFVAADRVRNRAYSSGEPMAWFIAGEIELRIVAARNEARRPTVDDLKRIAA